MGSFLKLNFIFHVFWKTTSMAMVIWLKPVKVRLKMPKLISQKDYYKVFVIYQKCNKVVTRICETFSVRHPQKRKQTVNNDIKIIQKLVFRIL